MNELSTRLYKVDFKYITKNCTRKELWKKSWVVYDYDGLRIPLKLRAIDIIWNQVQLDVGKLLWHTLDIPLDEAHYNEEVFTKSLIRRLHDNIVIAERDLIRKMGVYLNAVDYDDKLKYDLEERAKEFLDSEGVSNSSIRNAYVEAFVDEHYESYADKVLDQMLECVTPQRYLMLYTMFNDDLNYQRIVDKNAQEEDLTERFEYELKTMEVEYESMLEDLSMPSL